MQPPPSRYRVIERGGRLVVLDSAVGGAPLTARDLLPAMALDAGPDALSLESYPRESAEPESLALPPETLDPRLRGGTERLPPPPRPAAAQAMIAAPPGLLRNVASTICNDRRDRDGRLQWTTARWFDAKGPRTIALSDNAEQQLGLATLALLVVAVGAIVVAVGVGWVGFAILLVALAMLRQARPAATAWIDRLAAS